MFPWTEFGLVALSTFALMFWLTADETAATSVAHI